MYHEVPTMDPGMPDCRAVLTGRMRGHGRDWSRRRQTDVTIVPGSGGDKAGSCSQVVVTMVFIDRIDAGRQLAGRLRHLRGQPVVVLGLPRGGVPVAAQVAAALGAPLDVIIVRKLGVPFQPELAMGAVGEDGVLVTSPEVIRSAGITPSDLATVHGREQAEVEARAARYRAGRPRLDLTGKVAVIVDDGIATGATASAACEIARAHGAARVVLAAPVAPERWEDRIGARADEYVCVDTPPHFFAIGQFYANFTQTTDAEVTRLLEGARAKPGSGEARLPRQARGGDGTGPVPSDFSGDGAAVEPIAGAARLAGYLAVPPGAPGIVIFAHGSGSSRQSPRNRRVARILTEAGLGTLLFDLLTPAEELHRANVFDIALLAGRLTEVTAWLRGQPPAGDAAIGYFGASTGAAAALWAAAEPGANIAAVVSRGGRPDLAGPRLAAVTAPTLLIVGGLDTAVLDLNRRAEADLRCDHDLAIVPGATHLFEEPGTLDAAAELARDWFVGHMVPSHHPVT
jgi:putative phosphoribosyl transferase